MMNLISVDLGIKKIKIPVAEISSGKSGRALLITAGMDGDENSGIEAAYKLIEEFKEGGFRGNLTVIPIVNIPGFEVYKSYNPLDNKFPKDIYPGKDNGSSSERLIDWLNTNYISTCDVWLDLHGGAHDEMLEPSVLVYETKNKRINELLHKVISSVDIPKVVFHKIGFWTKIDLLAKKDIAYIIAEVGCSGDRNNKWLVKHVELAKCIMGALGMIEERIERKQKPRIYRKRVKLKAGGSGLWFPQKTVFIKKEQILGKLISLEGREIEIIKAKEDGEFLWGKENLFCKRGDILVEMCTELS
jgi:hypothetical protein